MDRHALESMTDAELNEAMKKKAAGEDIEPVAPLVKERKAGKITGAIMPKDDTIHGKAVKQEMHPQFTDIDRAMIKNMGNDPKSAAAWLAQRHPNMEIGISDNHQLVGRVRTKDQGEKYYALDPDTGFHPYDAPVEALRDLGDAGTDTVNAGLSTLASAGAAAAAAPFTWGLASLPAAMAGGGVTAAGGNWLQQRLGQALTPQGGLNFSSDYHGGLNQSVDPEQVKWAGAGGAIAPLIFGTGGKAVAPLLEEGAGTLARVANTAGRASTKLANSGGIASGYDIATQEIAPRLASALTNIPTKTIQNTPKYLQGLKLLEQEGPEEFAQNFGQKIFSTLRNLKKQAGEAMQNKFEQANVRVNLSSAEKHFQDIIDKYTLLNKERPNEAFAPIIAKAEEGLSILRGSSPELNAVTSDLPAVAPGTLNDVSAKYAFAVKDHLADMAEYGSLKPGNQVPRFGRNMSNSDKELAEAANAAYRDVSGQLESAAGTEEEKAAYKKYSDYQRYFHPKFSTPEKTMRSLSSMGNKDKSILFNRVKQLEVENPGLNLLDDVKQADVYNTFGHPSVDIPARGNSNTARSGRAAAIGGGLGYMAGKPFGVEGVTGTLGAIMGPSALSPAALRAYIESGLLANKAITKPFVQPLPQIGGQLGAEYFNQRNNNGGVGQ